MSNPLFTVARFEVKTLLRSWFFRIFSLIVIAFILFFNIMASTEVDGANWPDRMLLGGLPYMNLWVLNIVQAIIAVFLSADFLSRDKKLDTTEVIYVRDMSNFQYVIGKTMGILIVFGGLNLLVLSFTFVINLISPDAGFSLITYILYPLIISFPTLVFVLGLSFFVMQLVRNQAITFILVLGFIATTVFYLKGKHFGVWDFISFNTPLVYSAYVGFTNTMQLILVRGGYFLIGASFILFTVYKLPRLTQTKLGNKIILIPASLTMLLALLGIGYYLLANINREKQITRQYELEKALPINADYEISNYKIEIDHQGNRLIGNVNFQLKRINKTFPTELRFFFNNGLKATELKINGNVSNATQRLNILSCKNNITQADSLFIELQFVGTPNDKLAYFDLAQETREALHRYDPLLADKKSCFATHNYLLLTKESFWYPVVAERNALRVQKFFDYDLKIKSNNGLNYISQGIKTKDGEWTYFKGDKLYTKISLLGGNYQTKSIEVDGIQYAVSARKDGFFFEKYFENLTDTLPTLVKEIKQDFERKLGVKYPYNRLIFVEVPAHFQAHFRGWSISNDNTQPEMIFVPEVGAGIRDFNLASRFRNEERRVKREKQELLPKEIETNVFMNLMGNTFAQPVQGRRFFRNSSDVGRTLDNWSAYSVFPLFYNYAYSISENDLPFFNMCLESYMLSRVHESGGGRFGRMNSTDKSILFLNKNTGSLKELADKKDLEISIADIIVTVGNNQFAAAQSRIGKDNFSTFIDSLLQTNKMNVINQELISSLVSVDSIENDAINTDTNVALPSFLFGESKMYEFKDGNRKRYYISIEVANQGQVDGIIKASLMGGRGGGGNRRGNRGGGFGGRGGGRGMTTSFEEIYLIEKGENVRVGITVDKAPRMLSVHTYLSKNIPSDIRFPLADFEEAPTGFAAEVGKTPLKKQMKFALDNETIVDNEDEGFSVINTSGRKTLKEIILISKDEENLENGSEYKTLSPFRPAGRWTPVLNAMAFGAYTKSFQYKKAGDGSAKAQFRAQLTETGRYNVYAMIPSKRVGNFRNQDSEDAVYNFTVYHDDGESVINVPIDQDTPDWAFLGEFYLSDGEAKVELSDFTTKKVVIADAVKWVKL